MEDDFRERLRDAAGLKVTGANSPNLREIRTFALDRAIAVGGGGETAKEIIARARAFEKFISR